MKYNWLRLLPLSLAFFATSSPALQIGAWVGGEGQYPQPTAENVEAFEALQERPLEYITHFVLWDVNDWAATKPYADVASENGSTLVVTWMPNGYSAPEIVAGKADAYPPESCPQVDGKKHNDQFCSKHISLPCLPS